LPDFAKWRIEVISAKRLLISVLTLCLSSGHAQPKQDAKSAILARRAIWNKAIIERDFESLAGLTAPDFSLVGPGARLDGPERHKALFVSLLKRRPDLIYERTPVRVEVQQGQDFAHEIGTWRERWTEADGATELQGDYFVFWQQIGGDWKERAEIFSPSRCLGNSYCAAHPAASPAPMKRELAQNYAGWYAISENMVLEIRVEGSYLIAHCPALFGDRTLNQKSDTEFEWAFWTIRFSNNGRAVSAESVELVQGGKVVYRGKRMRLNL
jgi:ketosteroid isomerase-like protein